MTTTLTTLGGRKPQPETLIDMALQAGLPPDEVSGTMPQPTAHRECPEVLHDNQVVFEQYCVPTLLSA